MIRFPTVARRHHPAHAHAHAHAVRSSLLIAVTVAVAMSLSACASAHTTTPRARVAKDLGCTTEATGVRKIAAVAGENAARWEVSGCGRTAIYVCTTPVRECWREGDIRPDEDAR